MKIETKFNNGDKVLYFDVQNMKLIPATIMSTSCTLSDGKAEFSYGLNLVPYCKDSCELLDELQVWFKGMKDEEISNFVVEEKFLFGTTKEFLSFVFDEEQKPPTPIPDDYIPEFRAELPEDIIVDKSVYTGITNKFDGHTKEHSKQHQGNEQALQ